MTDLPLTPAAGIAIGLEILLVIAGAVLWWRLALSPAARARRLPLRLTPWTIHGSDFLLYLALALVGACLASAAAGLLLRGHSPDADSALVIGGGAMHLGVIGGLAAYYFYFRRGTWAAAPSLPEAFRTGAITFLIALPLLLALSNAWEALLRTLGLPDEQQELVDILENTHSNFVRIGLVVVATLIVPITEELVFRAGLYRFLRTRIPRWIALWGTALLFGALHVDWSHLSGLASMLPLTGLAIVFSLAYERTGHIGTTMVAHALFNLNTFVLILAGAGS